MVGGEEDAALYMLFMFIGVNMHIYSIAEARNKMSRNIFMMKLFVNVFPTIWS
jgi:hypothetical protein